MHRSVPLSLPRVALLLPLALASGAPAHATPSPTAWGSCRSPSVGAADPRPDAAQPSPLPQPAPWWPPPEPPRPLHDPLLGAFGVDRFQTPQVERPADPFAAGPLGPASWSLLPPLALPSAALPATLLGPLLPFGGAIEATLDFGSFHPAAPRSCRKRPATVVRFGGESDAFLLVDCDGAVRNEGLERLSVLARPPGAERPSLPLPDVAASSTPGEWVDHIRLLPPRLVAAVQRVVEAYPYRPIYLISGYRPGDHGPHGRGVAVDLFVMGVANERIYRICRKMTDVGCGFYPNNKFVHIDLRPPGTGKAYWIDTSAPGEPSHYVDSWPGVEAGGAAVWRGGD